MANSSVEDLGRLTQIMSPGAQVVLLESVDEINETEIRQKMTAIGVRGISVSDVSAESQTAQAEYFKERNVVCPDSSLWSNLLFQKDAEPVASKFVLIKGHF